MTVQGMVILQADILARAIGLIKHHRRWVKGFVTELHLLVIKFWSSCGKINKSLESTWKIRLSLEDGQPSLFSSRERSLLSDGH